MNDEQEKSGTAEERAPEARRDEGQFELDPELEEAMKAAEASLDRRAGEEIEVEIEEPGRPAAPTSGAGEGLVRALSELKQVRVEMETAQTKAKELEDRLLRTAADFENYKKRTAREREEERKYAVERLLKDLLPVVDNLDRATTAAAEAGDTQIVTGLQMVHKLFLDTLTRHGVELVHALGQPFDPNFHEAMQAVETDAQPPGTVVTEYMKGYTLHGRLVRPAMVVVAKAPSGAGAESTERESPGSEEATADEQGGQES